MWKSQIHNNVFYAQSGMRFYEFRADLLDFKQTFLRRQCCYSCGRAFSAAAVLPLYETRCITLSSAVSPALNVTVWWDVP